MAGIVNKVYCMQSLSFVYVLFHVVKGISLYTLSGVVNTANIEWSSFKWSLTRGQKQRKTIKPCSQKVVKVAYKRWTLTEKILVVQIHGRLEEDVICNRDGHTWRFDCNVRCISKRSSENNVPDCCDTTVEDASSIEDGEGVSVVLLSIARVVLATTNDKWL